jgi:hypothetical protein
MTAFFWDEKIFRYGIRILVHLRSVSRQASLMEKARICGFALLTPACVSMTSDVCFRQSRVLAGRPARGMLKHLAVYFPLVPV